MLGRVVTSWKTLSAGEIKKLTRCAREESGSGPGYRSVLIARMACDLWGSEWDTVLRERMQARFRVSTLNALTPGQAKAMMGEIVSCLARRDGGTLAGVRERFKIQNSRFKKPATDRTDETDQSVAPMSPSAVAGEDTRATTGTEALDG
jgi:hypothetical protein